MKAERWQHVKEVLEKAVDLEPDERSSYLDGACAADPELRQEVESLLVFHERAGDHFLQTPAADLLNCSAEDSVPVARVGRRVGVYQIVEEIGRGGMGEVYRATRVDGQYEKEVAVKLVRVGLDTSFVLERFRHERQILASLDHPNIARLLHGGTTEDGIPYLVMELIAGKPIDQYCDEHYLSITQRLHLFRQACSAVQYAHQRLVIHRDIKPSNILVTETGEPKLLDFGIAKILDPSADRETTVLRPMTPEYASPEQVRGQPITTASDVYSLGVVLYQLLTGRSPYSGDTSTAHQLARAVCEDEPAKPSAVIFTPNRRDNGTESSKELLGRIHEGSPAKLRRRLAGDLDNIALKALRKEPQRRYASVEQLAEDLRRHLVGLPVIARSDSWTYRAAKFTRRHKVGMLATAMVVLALLTGMVLTLREARIAQVQRQRAERRFNDVRRLANSLMFEVHDSIKDLPGSTPARKLLVSRALEYLDGLTQEAKGDESLQRELADAYERIGDVQGQPRQANLGDAAGAVASYKKALAIREGLAAANPKNVELLRELTPNYGRLSDLLWTMGDPQGAMEAARKEMAAAEAAYRANPNDPSNRLLLATFRMDYGYKQADIGNDRAGGLENLHQGSVMLEQMTAENPRDMHVLRTLGLSYSRAAGILEDDPADRDQALALYGKSIAVKQKLLDSDPNNTDYRRLLAYDQYSVGYLLADTDLKGALSHEHAALASFEQLARSDPANMQYQQDEGRTLGRIGQIMARMKDLSGAREQLGRSLDLLEKLPGTDNPQSIVGYAVASDQLWMGKVGVGLASSAGVSAQQRTAYCRLADDWFRKCLPAFEQLRDHASPGYEGAARVAEIDQQRSICRASRAKKEE
ncbi:MAG: serine/threonine protein kinase [Acidobacteriia bacterium]|nr:serine/threonine protein kinase [Terriglobia bacterium]